MITLLILIGLTFYQNLHTYHSDIVKYESTNSYLTCSDPPDACPKATQKTLKEVKAVKENTGNQSTKSGQKPKLSIPIKEINAALKDIKSPDSLTAKNEVAAFYDDGNKENQIEISGNIEKLESGKVSVIDATNTPLDRLLIPGPHIEINTAQPFAINPTAHYEPENEKVVEAKLHDIENEITKDNSSVISTEEIRFTSDENQISIDQSSMEIINGMNQKYRNHNIHVTGFGIDENDAVNMTLMVLEVIDHGMILDDVRTVSDKNKRMVIIEVLNEI